MPETTAACGGRSGKAGNDMEYTIYYDPLVLVSLVFLGVAVGVCIGMLASLRSEVNKMQKREDDIK